MRIGKTVREFALAAALMLGAARSSYAAGNVAFDHSVVGVTVFHESWM